MSDIELDAFAACLLHNPRFATLLAAHVDSAIKLYTHETKLKTEERLIAENEAFTTSKEWDSLMALSDAKTVKILVNMFLKTQIAKMLLLKLKGSVNRVYIENSIPGLVSIVAFETKHQIVLKSQLNT